VGEITTTAFHFSDFGPILGEMALLRSVGATIISVSGITQKGYVVMFDAKSVRLVGATGEVFMGSFDEDTRLFYIDIGLVLQHNSRHDELEPDEEVKSNSRGSEAHSVYTVSAQRRGKEVREEEGESSASRSTVASTSSKPRASRRGQVIARWLVEAVFDLHNRMSHPSAQAMSKAVTDRAWIGVHPDITAAVIDKVLSKRTCLACALGKMHRLVIPTGSGVRETVVAWRLSYDILGKLSPFTYNGGVFVHLFACAATGFLICFITRNKNRFTAEACVRAAVAIFAQHGHKVAELTFDAGSTENSAHLQLVFGDLAISPHPIAHDTQRQNFVERYVQTVYQRVATVMLNQSALKENAWGFAMDLDVATLNCTPNELTGSDTPYFLVTGKRPDISRLFKYSFGQLLSCYDGEQKTFAKGVLAISLGMGKGNGAVNVLIPGRGLRMFERYDVVPVDVHLLPATTEEITTRQPKTAKDGSVEFFSHVKEDIDQSFVATFGQQGGSIARNFKEATPAAIDPQVSGALRGTAATTANGEQEHVQAPAMRMLSDMQMVLREAWQACLKLADGGVDKSVDDEDLKDSGRPPGD